MNDLNDNMYSNILCFVGKDIDYAILLIKVIIKKKIKIIGVFGEGALSIHKKIKNIKALRNTPFLNTKKPWENPLFASLEYKNSIGINCGFELLIPEQVLNKIPFVNIHPAYLPYNKGCHHSFWSIMEKTPNGATIHWMDKDFDAGSIIDQVEFKDDGYMYAHQIQKKSNSLCIDLLEKNLEEICSGLSTSMINQDGSYHSKKQIINASTILEGQILDSNYLFDICRATYNKNNGFTIIKNGMKFLVRIDKIEKIK